MDKDIQEAIKFISSMRGIYIISQALYYGIQALESVEPEVYQEKSNINDMKFLRETVFNLPDEIFSTHKMQEALKQIETLKLENLWMESTNE